MNKLSFEHSFKLRQMLYLVMIGCFLFGSLQSVRAQNLVTFAQFLEKTGSQDFTFTNSGNNALFGTISGGSPIDFRYSNINGLDPSLRGFQDAHLFLNAATTQTAVLTGSGLLQPFNGTDNAIRIIRDTPAATGSGSRTNLLTVTFSPNTGAPALTGSNLGNSASFSATTPDHTVVFTSDFLNFSDSTQRNLALSFSSLLSNLSLGNGNFLTSFTAAGSGTFASNPPPTVINGTTAADVQISGRVLTANGRGLRNAQVRLTTLDGSTRTVITGIGGQYGFANLEAGQTFVLTVRSKQYQYLPQVLSPNESLSNLNFIAQP